MSILEALFLYLTLFFPAVLAESGAISPPMFSISQTLQYILVYNAPALALIWILLLKNSSFSFSFQIFRKKNLLLFIAALAGLLFIGFSASFLHESFSHFFPYSPDIPPLKTPNSPAGWAVLAVMCLSTGCLEESFFRVYLSERLKTLKFYQSMLISSVAFAYCHLYEGFFGILNALFAGIFLFFIYNSFSKHKPFAVIALAHGAYNALMYLFASI